MVRISRYQLSAKRRQSAGDSEDEEVVCVRGWLDASMVAMTKRAMSKEGEEEARRLVESVRGVPVTPWDEGGGRGSRYDFNIGKDGALEVTSLADEGAEVVLRRASRATTSRPSSRLTRTWLVMVDMPNNFGLTSGTPSSAGWLTGSKTNSWRWSAGASRR
ncbi:hypothetical protein BAY59_38225 [Prauserella coralliicola]|uniref:Uncharacterized protein n=2 Tax=Pseudonocardiaceae TaxID=2070 RepID=A0A318LIH8_9PSEU|nr:hypothetical protein A4R43_30335 [Amycolatopsis albispora]PXY16746.1 hypothetical protein BAY59_38225 [Prauserella coralliicola]PXY25724.1 hypothetical protein BA062_26805 [Prauserella flavalba]